MWAGEKEVMFQGADLQDDGLDGVGCLHGIHMIPPSDDENCIW